MNIVRPIYKAPIQVNRYIVRFKTKERNWIWTTIVTARNVMEAKKLFQKRLELKKFTALDYLKKIY